MALYGTVMIGRLKVPFERFEAEMRARPYPPGAVRGNIMRVDDGESVVGAFVFESKEAYDAIPESMPDQAEWFENVLSPMLDGDPTWMDGNWYLQDP